MTYQAGWAKTAIAVTPRGHAMQGYGMWHNRARDTRSTLWARAFYIEDAVGKGQFFCCMDLGYITHAMREGVMDGLQTALGSRPDEASVVLTCTHTHSGPGGCTHDVLYNVVTPGFVPENLERIVSATVQALLAAQKNAAPTDLRVATGRFADEAEVAWNRSLRAYNSNPDVTPVDEKQRHLAVDRSMAVLGFYRDGKPAALISFFGVHATCVGNALHSYDGDNKGYAATHAEQTLAAAGAADPVAVFAQGTAGDVSPYYHGPGDKARRRKIRGEAEYEYARKNGERQSELALRIVSGGGQTVGGAIDGVFSYIDFTVQAADPAYTGGVPDARTSEPCHGVAFFQGTPVDGPGMPKPLGVASAVIADALRAYRLSSLNDTGSRAYYTALYAAQGPKKILLEAGRKKILGSEIASLPLPDVADPLVKELKRQARSGAMVRSAMVPTVLPLQILRIGTLAIVCCPGEFTTTAGKRVLQAAQAELQAAGIAQVLLCTYCNEYMGYVTTAEEYRQQCYEGGHTIFGQWTLAAFQTRFRALATQLGRADSARDHDRSTRPQPTPPDELALRSNLEVPHG